MWPDRAYFLILFFRLTSPSLLWGVCGSPNTTFILVILYIYSVVKIFEAMDSIQWVLLLLLEDVGQLIIPGISSYVIFSCHCAIYDLFYGRNKLRIEIFCLVGNLRRLNIWWRILEYSCNMACSDFTSLFYDSNFCIPINIYFFGVIFLLPCSCL